MAQTKDGAIKVSAKKHGITVDELIYKLETEKFCTKCKTWVNRSNFGKDTSRYDGTSARCFSCSRVNRPHKSHKGRISPFKGKNHTEEYKKNLSEKRKGSKSPMDGKKHSLESRVQMSKRMRANDRTGEKSHSYKDGLLAERRGQRFSGDYKRWRYDVFMRDEFTCQKCGDNKGGNLNAHHIKQFADFPELRFEVSNGITLCEPCHKKEHAA